MVNSRGASLQHRPESFRDRTQRSSACRVSSRSLDLSQAIKCTRPGATLLLMRSEVHVPISKNRMCGNEFCGKIRIFVGGHEPWKMGNKTR